MKKIIIPFVFVAMLVLGALSASAYSCAVSPGFDKPLLPDTDCDGIVDMADNCPFITNPIQQDADRNGLGDACDLHIESIRTNPANFVFNGRAFSTVVTLENNRDYNIKNMKVRVFMPELGIESVQYVSNLNVCQSKTLEFTLRAPICEPMGDYLIITEVSFMNEFSEEEVIPGMTSMRIIPDDHCQMVLANGEAVGNTHITVMEIQDVYKGGEAVFPIKIANREDEGKEYVLSVTGLDNWGSARLYPSTLLIVPSGADRMADLYVRANDNAAPGERSFVVSVQSGEEVQRFILIANVKENVEQDMMFVWLFAFKIVIIVALVCLLVFAVILGFKKYNDYVKGSPDSRYY